MTTLVPPIKCQGIKTKLAHNIREAVPFPVKGRWIEPFCGSCVVALNIRPERAHLSDTNQHIIRLYQDIQQKVVTPFLVKEFLQLEGSALKKRGGDYYYQVRERFNANPTSLDFLFLNRACFNGVMRFNRKGHFNVPFGNKPERFRQAYITKIVNQVKTLQEVTTNYDWQFAVADFRVTLAEVTPDDFVYADPPYSGRHTDYFNTWGDNDEADLVRLLQDGPGRFLLSTWHHNQYRKNEVIDIYWQDKPFAIRTLEHFYHVGATEDLRSAMTEALVANYPLQMGTDKQIPHAEQMRLL